MLMVVVLIHLIDVKEVLCRLLLRKLVKCEQVQSSIAESVMTLLQVIAYSATKQPLMSFI